MQENLIWSLSPAFGSFAMTLPGRTGFAEGSGARITYCYLSYTFCTRLLPSESKDVYS